jgi:chitinase
MIKPRRKILLIAIVVLIISLLTIQTAFAADRGAWAPNTAYAVNDTVTYGGHTYKCLQAHTSLVGWEPPNVPALWQDLGGGATTPPPTTPPPTTPPPTTPPPTTPPPTTPPPGGTCWAAWVSSQVYTGGAQVSRSGQNYQAAYWTQNQDPVTNSGPAGSGKPWIPKGACSGGTVTPPPTTPPPTTPPPTTPPPTTPPPTTQPPPGGTRILGYFVEWGIYGRNYQPKNLVTSGSAAKITHINFAFGNVTNGQCALADSYADYDKFYDAASSVDGTSDSWDAGSLRGIFGQFRKLKAMYPHIKILWSFGGWTYSGGFAQAAANPTAFANSCYNLVHDARWNGVFDGIDIDWEYPNACGLTCDSSGFNSFRVLMQALRARFGSELVTAAVTASAANVDRADYAGAAQYVNWYNIMTYDYFGAFNAQGPTAPHSPLSSYPGIPTAGFNTQDSIAKYRSIGIPANKLMFGLGFYGRGWTGVTQSAPGGSATGAAAGQYEAGINDYKVLVSSCPATGTVGGTAYAFCGNNWWSYDTPATIAAKMNWMKSQGLLGTFFWEFSGDTTAGALISAIYNNR